MKKLILLVSLLSTIAQAKGNPNNYVAGFNIIQGDGYLFDASPAGQPKTPAQNAVDEIKRLGSNHVELNVKATMKGPRSTEIYPDVNNDAAGILRLIRYIKSQGMTVGMRPIFFVVGPNGEFPYFEEVNGKKFLWWHGNIQPADPNRWFTSFQLYLDKYLTPSIIGKVDSFTIGAELYSMTVGIEDQWLEYPYGFPGRWLSLLRYVKSRFAQQSLNTRVMYDANFTDATIETNGIQKSGGELERWRYRIVDLAEPKDPAQFEIWRDLVSFWNELDAVGIDMYRSLASNNQSIPGDYGQLVQTLKLRTDSYANQMDTTLNEIALISGRANQVIIFKEVGFKSLNNGFIDPFSYANNNGGGGSNSAINMIHQAASYDAIFQSFWAPQWAWFRGAAFWNVSLNPAEQGPQDGGFSPVGKETSEKVISDYYK